MRDGGSGKRSPYDRVDVTQNMREQGTDHREWARKRVERRKINKTERR